MINEGVNAALTARDATRNGDDSHTSGTGARRPVQAARECSYSEFLKCKPLDYKAYAMTWATLKKKMTGKYCPRGEIKKIKTEMWNLKADNKRNLRTSLGKTRINNHIRDKTQARFILQEMVTRDFTQDLGLYVPSAITIMKNNDHGNQARNDRAPARVYAVGNAGANPDIAVAGTFLLNNHCASILFDTGADK
nr:hypothetical protein [Tanacetum cinerariifolium]